MTVKMSEEVTAENRLLPLKHATEQLLEKAGFAEKEVPVPFHQRHGQGSLTSTLLTGSCWEHKRATARSTYIFGPKVEIFNVMGFPANPTSAPVYASEIIHFANAPRVIVIDVQPVWSPELQETKHQNLMTQLATVKHKYKTLPSGGELPDWCKDFFTPHCIYSRPNDFSVSDKIAEAHLDYLKLWLENWIETTVNETNGKTSTDSDSPSYVEQLREYKHHHVANSPGTKYLGRVFGDEWTDDYLNRFMYA
jgi:hypothetical protein